MGYEPALAATGALLGDGRGAPGVLAATPGGEQDQRADAAAEQPRAKQVDAVPLTSHCATFPTALSDKNPCKSGVVA